MNVVELPDDEGSVTASRIFCGDGLTSGRILLTTNGRAFVEFSCFAGLGELRRGNRKSPPHDAVLHALMTIFVGAAADELTYRTSSHPATTLEESAEHFRIARNLERKAVSMRIEAIMLLDAPADAAQSAHDFESWFETEVVGALVPSERAGVDVARRTAKKALCDGWKLGERASKLKGALETLTELHLRPPSKAELWKELEVLRDDRKGWRDLLMSLGFDWLPSGGKGGRPQKV